MTGPRTGQDELSFDVEGMTCSHCERAITDEVCKVDGVTDVQVDLGDTLVTVRGEELVEQVVRDAILLAGYDARRR